MSRNLERAGKVPLLAACHKIEHRYNRNVQLPRISNSFLYIRNVHIYPRFVRMFLQLENSHENSENV